MEAGSPAAHYTKCRELLAKYKRNLRIRMVLLGIFLAVGIFLDAYRLELGHLILCIVCSVGLLALAMFISHESLVRYILLLAAAALFTVTKIIPWPTGIAALVIYLTAVPEYAKMTWIRLQPGYPHFSERFDTQLAHADYEPEYHAALQDAALPEPQEVLPAPPAEQPAQAEMPAIEMPDLPDTEDSPDK